jgi:hypothetical protein
MFLHISLNYKVFQYYSRNNLSILSNFLLGARVTFVTAKVTKTTAPNALPCGFPAMLM